MPKSNPIPTPIEFFVDPLTGGRVTPRALIATEGTVSVPFSRELLEKRISALICRIAGFGWYFNIGYLDGRLVIQRPGAELSIDEAWCRDKALPECALVSWKLDALILSFGTHLTHWDFPQVDAPAEPIPPPPELVAWVRSKEMTPVTFFASQEEFAMRVHSSLQRFEERLGPVLSRDFFWDLERVGNRIVTRNPVARGTEGTRGDRRQTREDYRNLSGAGDTRQSRGHCAPRR